VAQRENQRLSIEKYDDEFTKSYHERLDLTNLQLVLDQSNQPQYYMNSNSPIDELLDFADDVAVYCRDYYTHRYYMIAR
jgi:hypothetical protein